MFEEARRLIALVVVGFLMLVVGAPGEPTTETEPPAGQENGEAEAVSPLVLVVRWDDAITPVTRSFLADAIEKATARGAAALVIELDTPGGLIDTTRDIVTDFFDSPIPILVWVGPSGARAASASPRIVARTKSSAAVG